MHWYTRFCIFGWVLNSAVEPNQKRKCWIARWKRAIQTHTLGLLIKIWISKKMIMKREKSDLPIGRRIPFIFLHLLFNCFDYITTIHDWFNQNFYSNVINNFLKSFKINFILTSIIF